jgi:tetratricopeptide (TPR) repeat protein
MKIHFNLLLIFMFASIVSLAQPAKKTKQPIKEKSSAQKEMQNMMKEMQKAIVEMSVEDKKTMDSMGIKVPSMKNIPKLSDKQQASAWENENRRMPKRDAIKIAGISKTVTSARIGAFIASIQNSIATLKPDTKNMGGRVYNFIKSRNVTNAEAGNMAVALWIDGKPELSVYVLGKFCTDASAEADNFSNYASMLSMLGAQHLAIPILNNLNARFPKNSTLLNNLGQAWFGLGEIDKAEKYLDSTIRIYAWHPQANFTKSLILESRGDKSGAIEAMRKSIRYANSDEKANRLNKLGYKLTKADVRLPFKPGTDPLGLARFRQPDYPKSVNELKVLNPLWETFDNDCMGKVAMLQKELVEATIKYEQSLKSSMMQSMHKPLYVTKASLELQEVERNNEAKMKRLSEMHIALATQLDQLQKTRKRAAPEAPCRDHINAENDFLNKCNGLKKVCNDQALQVFKLFYNDMAYWSQYTCTSKAQFEIIKLEFEIDWLMKLREYRPLLTAEGYEAMAECVEEEEEKSAPAKPAEFDDVACQYNSTIDLKIIKFINNCSRMTSEFDLMFLKYTRKDNFERAEGDTYVGSTIKISAEIGKGLEAGPLKAEAKLGAAVELEFDSEGVKDIILIGEAKLGAGTSVMDEYKAPPGISDVLDRDGIGLAGKDAFPTTMEVGVEGRISLISGSGSVKGTGVLDKVTISSW